MRTRQLARRRDDPLEREGSTVVRDRAAARGGQPLPRDTRVRMEQGFGHSFEDVRVHEDGAADALAGSLQATAFTYGSDVYFRAGAYDPESSVGERLLAHELTHVVQQDGAQGGADDGAEVPVSHPEDAAEREAAAASDQIAAGRAADVSVSAAPAVQRFWNPLEDAGNWLGDQAYEMFGGGPETPDALAAGVDTAKGGAAGLGVLRKVADFFTHDLVPDGADGLTKNSNPLLGSGGVMDTTLSAAGVALNVMGNLAAGQGAGESVAGAAGSLAASKGWKPGGVGGGIDTAINATNSVLKAAGAPQEVTDVSSLVANATSSNFVSAGLSNLGRGLWNFASGDDKALDKQFDDIQSGKSGAAWQGWSMLPQVAAGLLGTDESWETTIMKVGSKGQDSSAARVGNWLGDQAFQFINKDLPEAAEFAAKDESTTGRIMNWLLN